MRAGQATGKGFSFGHWRRTGRLILADPRWGAREVKFNPHHDPKDGRFTFGEGGSAGMSRPPKTSTRQTGREDPRIAADDRARKARVWANSVQNPENQEIYTVQKGDTLTKIAAMRTDLTPSDLEWLNGLSGDQIRAGGTLKIPSQASLDASRQAVRDGTAYMMYMGAHGGNLPPIGQHPTIGQEMFGPGTHVETRNGYDYTIDPAGNTRLIDGTITRGKNQGRDRKVQAAAGLPDRLPTDQGGHYIARRFNGPTDAFNHFAQDENFNKSSYAKLEHEWDRLDRQGKRVHVTIIPEYSSPSRRPYRLEVTYTVGGSSKIEVFRNRSSK
ncbi:DNA/RNA non-specific endonuclease [Sphingomonas bacterium]|uniref:DNA/RNA non-specific endonuclease n=1 Tax=Sphingomonas bacterium TaxID=1895847 RepID=UPI00157502BD|nr:DNA/RNA non-specific endonuclease [Sphingomonas bacterium]